MGVKQLLIEEKKKNSRWAGIWGRKLAPLKKKNQKKEKKTARNF